MRLTAIHRYPVKGLGEEALGSVTLAPGKGLPLDRAWAITHQGSEFDPEAPAWVPRRNFVQTAQSPELATVQLSHSEGRLTLSGADREPLTADPDDRGGAEIIAAWIEGVGGRRQPGPYALVRLPDQPMWDVADAPISIMSDASLRALSQHGGRSLSRRRFRGNLWIDGLPAWAEFDLVGREIAVGDARLRVTSRIDRCAAPSASPATGVRDTDVVALLRQTQDHIDFGVYAQVVAGSEVEIGDRVTA